MVKVHAPVLSQDAAGRLAGTLVFQHHKRGISLKKLTKPKQPRTRLQINTRVAVKQLGTYWATDATAVEADWKTYGDTIGKDAYRAFMHYNLMRWRRFEAPTRTYPGVNIPFSPTYSNFAAAAQGRRIAWSFDLDVHDYARLVIFWTMPTGSIPTDFLYAEQVERIVDLQTYQFLTRPMPPAFYFCRIQLIRTNGAYSTISSPAGVDLT